MLTTILVFIYSILLGSFLNVLIYRIPLNKSIAFPPSSCPTCNNKLKWWHNIPILSWILLKGKCYYCKEKISIQYPLIELFVGFIGLISLYLYNNHYLTLLGSIFFFIEIYLLTALVAIDLKYKAVPDILNIPASIITIFIIGNSLNDYFINFLFWIGTGMFFYIIVIKIYSKLRRIDLLGEGDIPILMSIGALTHENIIVVILLSSIIGIFHSIMIKDKEIPFFPSLVISLSIVLFLQFFYNFSFLSFF